MYAPNNIDKRCTPLITLINSNYDFTYLKEGARHYSTIDHYILSNVLDDCVENVVINYCNQLIQLLLICGDKCFPKVRNKKLQVPYWNEYIQPLKDNAFFCTPFGCHVVNNERGSGTDYA